MPIPLSRHAHFTESLKPWYTRVKPWKFLVIFLALTWFMIAQSEIIDMPKVANNAVSIWKDQTHTDKKAPSPKPTSKKIVITPEFQEAVNKAQNLADTGHLSEEALRDQLTIKGEHYSPEMAQYAIEHVKTDYHANALTQAKDLQNKGVTTPEDMIEQLTGPKYKFTPADAEFALRALYPDDIVNYVLERDHES